MRRLLVSFAVVALAATACGQSESSGGGNGGYSEDDPADDQSGWVQIGNEVEKKCDGNNLVYASAYDGSIAVSPDDPTCRGSL